MASHQTIFWLSSPPPHAPPSSQSPGWPWSSSSSRPAQPCCQTRWRSPTRSGGNWSPSSPSEFGRNLQDKVISLRYIFVEWFPKFSVEIFLKFPVERFPNFPIGRHFLNVTITRKKRDCEPCLHRSPWASSRPSHWTTGGTPLPSHTSCTGWSFWWRWHCLSVTVWGRLGRDSAFVGGKLKIFSIKPEPTVGKRFGQLQLVLVKFVQTWLG